MFRIYRQEQDIPFVITAAWDFIRIIDSSVYISMTAAVKAYIEDRNLFHLLFSLNPRNRNKA